MKQGAIELAFLVIAFLSLQAWWIWLTIKNGQYQKEIVTEQDLLSVYKERLENLLRK
tara:strand:- start:122 stop:292 length:171 start_codon:yes stop_codon:yes gene_type:complete